MKLRLMAGLAGLLILISSAMNAQVQTESGVARVSLIHGDVSTQRGDSGDWAAAALNAPIVGGDRISTGDKSRAEVQLDYANILRLDERTQANITGLSRTQIQVQLGRGLANYSVFKDGEADVEIDTPNMSLHPNRRDGSYRILVVSDDQTEVLVRKGDAEVSTPQGRTHLEKGQMITVRGTGNDTQYKIADAPSKDDFDRWNNDRDNTIRNAQAWKHTNRYYVGTEDLDAYGHWTSVPDYGSVWVPTADYGWAPYRAGRWVWEPYWGWTWVSYEPWGWAPYHYGRWFLYGSSWVWWPGQSYGYRHYRPIWAPAYVSFFGFGNGGGFGFGFGSGWGSIGWLPIGPCDHFYPWYGGYRSRFNVVNVTNIYNYHNGGIPPLRSGTRYSNIRLAMNNDRIRQAVSTVPSNDFGRGRTTAQPVSRELFRDGKVVAGNLPVVPTRESLLAGERRAAPPAVGRGAQPERFFTKNRTVATPQSFEREAAEVHSAIKRDGRFTPVVGNQRSTASESNPRPAPRQVGEGPGVMKHGEPAGNNNPNQSWRRLGQPAQSPAPGTASTPSNPGQRKQVGGENSDWRRVPNSGAPQSPAGRGTPNTGNRPGNANTPDTRRAPTPEGNQQWRRFDRAPEPATRGTSNPTEAPASRDRFQREDPTPTPDRGNDWRRMPPSQNSTPDQPSNRTERNDSWDRSPSRGSAPQAQRDSGNWRQSPPRDSGREVSRPPLDMRQPIVTPRSSGPGPSGGSRGNGGNSGGGRSTPNRGGGEQHPSGGNAPHRGR
ncbi:MAG: FecR domain-containing protein [Acidobacteriales bacterium]|nr:FecR domain-containing protein [Terriglobales bacterium]